MTEALMWNAWIDAAQAVAIVWIGYDVMQLKAAMRRGLLLPG